MENFIFCAVIEAVRSAHFEIFAKQMLRVQITATRKADEDLSYMRLT